MENKHQKIYSNGKLLISGEYAILKGALALAVPVIFGQSLTVSQNTCISHISWKSTINSKPWYDGIFFFDFSILKTSNKNISERLTTILKKTKELNPDFIEKDTGYEIFADLNFNINWGLGSSSSLISNIAQFANINPFELNKGTSQGSGYDIACARSNNPILFKLSDNKPQYQDTVFSPEFKDQLYFIYLGKKQNTNRSVEDFLMNKTISNADIEKISELTKLILTTKQVKDFNFYIKEHEQIIASLIRKSRIKDEYFPDFKGEIKSLGAWGGDFALVVWGNAEDELRKYFEQKGLTTIFSFDQLILS